MIDLMQEGYNQKERYDGRHDGWWNVDRRHYWSFAYCSTYCSYHEAF